MMPVAVSLANVSKKFILHHERNRSFQDAIVNFFHRRNGSREEFWALKDASFTVERGETVGIVGHNGSGKSTMLKIITRILEPTAGRVTVNGKVSALIELGAGFHPDLTGRENVYLNGSILGLSRKEMRGKFDQIVAFSELARFIDTPVKHYSSGMFARLGFSVAISIDPDILIVDEVLSVGDQGFQQKCVDKIEEFRRQGKTMLFVSHGLPTVEKLCDRVVWLDHGVIRAQGPAAETIQQYVAELQRQAEQNQEAERQQAVTAAWDAGGARLLETELMNGQREEADRFRTGDTLIFRLHYGIGDPSAEYVCRIRILRWDGVLVYSTSHRCQPLPSAAGAGEGFAEVEFPDLPLLAGAYDLKASIGPAGQAETPTDKESHTSRFTIGGEAGQAGIVDLPHRWVEVTDQAFCLCQIVDKKAGRAVR